MIQLHKIEDSRGINLNKTDESKECKICHQNYFSNGFKSHSKIYNCDWENFTIINSNGISYRFFMFDMTEEDVIELISDFEFDK